MSSSPPTIPTFVAGQLVTLAQQQALADGVKFFTGAPRSGQPQRPYFHLAQTVAQSIAGSSSTPLLFDSEVADTDAGHSTSSNTSRYTCQTRGTYRLTGTYISATGASTIGAFFRVNGSGGYWYAQQGAAAGALESAINISGPVPLRAGDYVELMGFHDASSAKNTGTGHGGCRLAGRWTGP